jgi:hypothetical protein
MIRYTLGRNAIMLESGVSSIRETTPRSEYLSRTAT